jgi:hypothetical protein
MIGATAGPYSVAVAIVADCLMTLTATLLMSLTMPLYASSYGSNSKNVKSSSPPSPLEPALISSSSSIATCAVSSKKTLSPSTIKPS